MRGETKDMVIGTDPKSSKCQASSPTFPQTQSEPHFTRICDSSPASSLLSGHVSFITGSHCQRGMCWKTTDTLF